VSLDSPCMAHDFCPKRVSNHCQCLCGTFSEIYTKFDIFIYQIHREITSGQIHDSKWKDINIQHIQSAAWDVVHWLPRYASAIIYRCIALLQLLYRWQNQSRKLWTPARNK
jgi:hypothetical protein